MSKFLNTRRLLISTLAPVHMGTDEDYEPTNYVIDGNTLYEFDPAGVADAIPERNRKQLEKLLSGKPDTRMLKAVQGFFYENRERLIPAAVNVVRAVSGVAQQYEARIGRAANVEADGREQLNQLQIERCFYNPVDRRPILPGTGLKGAIRTALLDRVNGGKSARGGESSRDLQQRLFNYSMRDLHKDPMRLVQLGDAAWRQQSDLGAAEIYFAVNRKKNPVEKDGSLVQSQAEQHGLHQVLECVAAFRMRAFDGSLTIPNVAAAGNSPRLPDQNLRFNFEDIAGACNGFYRPILNAELTLLRERGYLNDNWGASLEKLLNGPLAERMQRNETFLLRVGRHSGAESVTLNGVRSIRIMKGRGEKPDWSPQSKTLWLAADQLQEQRNLLPFGWLLVEFLERGESVPEWPEAEIVILEHTAELKAWREQVQSRQASLQKELQARKEEAAQRQKEEAARQQKEERERVEEEKRLAILSGMAREFEVQARNGKWASDKNAFSQAGVIEGWLGQLEQDTDDHVQQRLVDLVTVHFKGLLQDPDKVKGKKKKPVFNDRQREIAKRLSALREQ